MMHTLARFFLRRMLAVLGRIGRIEPVSIPPGEVVSASRLTEENRTRLRQLLESLGSEILYEDRSAFGSTFFIERASVGLVMRAIEDLQKDNYAVDVMFFMQGGRRKLRALSKGLSFILRWLIPPHAVDEVVFYRIFNAPGARRRYYRSYASRIRFMVADNGWWINPWSDVGSPPVQFGHVAKLGLPTVGDITFPVDLVYTWVDGADPAWCERKDEALRALGREVPRRSANRSRWENRDELRYSLRSVALFAPWIRHIYIVTDRQTPAWLEGAGEDRIRIIDHRDIFPEGSSLPNFNSHAIESVLHRIEGLSEHFLYMNDDFFFGAPTTPEDFFTAAGHAKVFYSRSLMPVGEARGREKASEWGGINASRLLERSLGRAIRHKVKHTPLALRRSVLRELEERFADEFARVRATPFRSESDISPLTALYVNYAVATGTAVSTEVSYAYMDIGQKNARRNLKRYLHGTGRKVFCLNDTEEYEGGLSWEKKDEMVRGFLERLYPWRSPWEAAEVAPVAGKPDPVRCPSVKVASSV